jgi:hypothetical protein
VAGGSGSWKKNVEHFRGLAEALRARGPSGRQPFAALPNSRKRAHRLRLSAMTRSRLFGWVALAAAIGVGITLGVGAATDNVRESSVGRIHEQVDVAAKVAGKWAADNKRPGKKVDA